MKSDVIIERDHGGPDQGSLPHMLSLHYDTMFCQLIHIDPWKNASSFDDGIRQTIDLINFCYLINCETLYEVGTEESIRRFSLEDYYKFINRLKYGLSPEVFRKIKYMVVQSGVGLDLVNKENTGIFDAHRLKTQAALIHPNGILCKEHNGDYLTPEQIKMRIYNGVDAINIAPEFGQIETEVIMDMFPTHYLDMWGRICDQYKPMWEKWGNPMEIEKKILIGGHYTFNDPNFIDFKSTIRGWRIKVKTRLRKRMKEIIECFE
jgi:hypothetical protein